MRMHAKVQMSGFWPYLSKYVSIISTTCLASSFTCWESIVSARCLWRNLSFDWANCNGFWPKWPVLSTCVPMNNHHHHHHHHHHHLLLLLLIYAGYLNVHTWNKPCFWEIQSCSYSVVIIHSAYNAISRVNSFLLVCYTSRSMCAMANMAVFCSSLISCFPRCCSGIFWMILPHLSVCTFSLFCL